MPVMLEAKWLHGRWLYRCVSCSRGPMGAGPMQQHLMSQAHAHTIESATLHMETARWVTLRTGK